MLQGSGVALPLVLLVEWTLQLERPSVDQIFSIRRWRGNSRVSPTAPYAELGELLENFLCWKRLKPFLVRKHLSGGSKAYNRFSVYIIRKRLVASTSIHPSVSRSWVQAHEEVALNQFLELVNLVRQSTETKIL